MDSIAVDVITCNCCSWLRAESISAFSWTACMRNAKIIRSTNEPHRAQQSVRVDHASGIGIRLVVFETHSRPLPAGQGSWTGRPPCPKLVLAQSLLSAAPCNARRVKSLQAAMVMFAWPCSLGMPLAVCTLFARKPGQEWNLKCSCAACLLVLFF